MKKNTNADNRNKQKPQPEKKTLQQFLQTTVLPLFMGVRRRQKYV